MGQEVKNPLRAQSKHGLMGSSAKTEKKNFRGSPEHFLDKNAIWDGHPPPTHQLQSTCVGEGSRVPNLQTEFNYLDSFKSYGIFSDFVVPMWAPSSSRHPCCPHVIPVSSPSSPHCPHVIPMSSPSSPEGPHVVSMVCGLHMLSLSSPHRPCHPRVISVVPTSSRRSPHYAQPPRYPLYPPPTPLGEWRPRISKNAIRFELIKIF